MGIYQEKLYQTYGKHHEEALFYCVSFNFLLLDSMFVQKIYRFLTLLYYAFSIFYRFLAFFFCGLICRIK